MGSKVSAHTMRLPVRLRCTVRLFVYSMCILNSMKFRTKVISVFLTVAVVSFAWAFVFGLPNFLTRSPVVTAIKGSVVGENVELVRTKLGGVLSWLDIDGESIVTRQGVIELTNSERIAAGLLPFTENVLLNAAAESKLRDMFLHQYFEHVSPDGKTPSYFAEEKGYSYIVIGENIALGDFENDRALVTAWMESPEHRDNILSDVFDDIGVAVGRGSYQGEVLWIAVQQFGKPFSACPQVPQELREKIGVLRQELDLTKKELDELKREIDESRPNTDDERSEYNKKVEAHNELVAEYKTKAEYLTQNIDSFNAQVREYNLCTGV